MFKRGNIILFILFLFFPLFSQACFNPTDSFAVEVWLNKPEIGYDLTILAEKTEDEIFNQEGGLIYRSHFNSELGVILRELEQTVGPEGYIQKGLDVKIQMPTERIETAEGFDLKSAIDIDPNQFDWQEALRTELVWLRENKIISGLTDNDLNLIYQVTARGTAGHNRKIVWGKGPEAGEYTWLPYDKTGNPLLIKMADCGGFSLSMLPKKQLDLKSKTTITKPNQLYLWLAIIIQIIIFIALLVYCLFLIRKFFGKKL